MQEFIRSGNVLETISCGSLARELFRSNRPVRPRVLAFDEAL